MKNRYLFEPFLASFYLAEAVCRHFLSEGERKDMFARLARVFCIPEGLLGEYYRESNEPYYRDIVNLADYNRLCRTLELEALAGREVEITNTDRLIMAQKCVAMKAKDEILKNDTNITRSALYLTLSDLSELGNVNAMTLFAFLEYNGICLCEDKPHALINIRRAAEWNDAFACLMGLAYDTDRSIDYASTLYTVLALSGRKTSYESIRASYSMNERPEIDPLAELLEKAFGIGLVKRNTYNRCYADLIGSELVSIEDKRSLVNSTVQDVTTLISKIPFGASVKSATPFDSSVVNNTPLRREDELRRIVRHVTVESVSRAYTSKPLMIASADSFVTDMYRDMLRAGFGEDKVIEIDARNLGMRDLDSGYDNVFLRGIARTRSVRTVFMIHGCEELDQRELDMLAKWLNASYRKSFEIYNLPISIDLSGMMLILFAASKSSELSALTSRCDMVFAERVKSEEKRSMIEVALASELLPYDSGMSMTEEGFEFLESCDTNRIGQIIASAVRNAVYEGRREIVLGDVKEGGNDCPKPYSAASFGFNGGNNHA